MFKYKGLKNGVPDFDLGNSAPPRWLIDSISPVAGGRPMPQRAVLTIKDGNLVNKAGRVFRPGDHVCQADCKGHHVPTKEEKPSQ